ncbi:MAG: ABC transporter substrate-binding protein [Bryobacteraceae bacterium]|nr:ABC transporter substrate-binding protein [Bryobacteraceae bacterium]
MRYLTLLSLLGLASCAKPDPLRVRLVTFQGAEAPLLAQKLGFFAQEGLVVDLQEISGAGKAMEALLSGSADSIVGTYEQAIQAQALGKPVVAYLQLTDCHCLAMVAAPGKGITEVGQLKGKVIGVAAPGGQMQNFATRLLEQAGLAPTDVSFAAIGVGPSALVAIESGKVDAAIVLASTLVPLRQRNANAVTLAETFSPEGNRRVFGSDGYPSMSLLAQRDWLKANPDRARRMTRALRAAVNWIKSNPPEAVLAKLGAGNLEALRLHLPRYDPRGEFQLEQTRTVLDFLARHNPAVRDAKMNSAQTFTNEFAQPASGR